MEHYDWNDGWLFAPTFDPAIVRPECTGVELEPVRLPHTVKTLPYNYCNENEYQRVSGYRREFFAPKEWQGRTVLLTFGAVAHDATVFCNGRRVFHHGCGYTAFTVDLTESLLLGQKNVVAVRCDSREDLNIPPLRRADRFSDLRRHLPGRQSGREGARLPARYLHRGAGRGRFPHLFLHSGRDHRLHPASRDPQPRREQSPVQR